MCPGTHPGTGGKGARRSGFRLGAAGRVRVRLSRRRTRECPVVGTSRMCVIEPLPGRECSCQAAGRDRSVMGIPEAGGRRFGRFVSIPSGIYSGPGHVKQVSVPTGRLGL
ncbi:hypothetical protein NRB_40470 [Novosphingobium sp. 11B]